MNRLQRFLRSLSPAVLALATAYGGFLLLAAVFVGARVYHSAKQGDTSTLLSAVVAVLLGFALLTANLILILSSCLGPSDLERNRKKLNRLVRARRAEIARTENRLQEYESKLSDLHGRRAAGAERMRLRAAAAEGRAQEVILLKRALSGEPVPQVSQRPGESMVWDVGGPRPVFPELPDLQAPKTGT